MHQSAHLSNNATLPALTRVIIRRHRRKRIRRIIRIRQAIIRLALRKQLVLEERLARVGRPGAHARAGGAETEGCGVVWDFAWVMD